MSKVLMIRHLPEALSFAEKEQLLKHFGAERVWQNLAKRNYVFAAFITPEQAKTSLNRLHQLQIANRRLVVEYSSEYDSVSSNAKQENETSSMITKHIKDFLRNLNAWNPSVDFYPPPPPYLKYDYPGPTPEILINIVYALWSHKPLYVQLLHLMNKMSLDSPFRLNKISMETFKSLFKAYFIDTIANIPQPASESESELSSDEKQKEQLQKVTKLSRRKSFLPKTRKRVGAVLATATLPTTKKKLIHQEVFEDITLQEPKKISVLVSQDSLDKRPKNKLEAIGEIGKLQKEETKNDSASPITDKIEADKPTVTKRELLQNKISFSDMKRLQVFKNYHPGEPSMRLYIKNLAKTVNEQDVIRIYRRFVEGLEQNKQDAFDVRIMQEGKMKGQGFVTFPSVQIAQIALNETNGYILKEKPIVVQFARAANKKNI